MNLIQNFSSSSNDFLPSSQSPKQTENTSPFSASTNAATNMMASAFASVSEMANKANNMFIPNENDLSATEFVLFYFKYDFQNFK